MRTRMKFTKNMIFGGVAAVMIMGMTFVTSQTVKAANTVHNIVLKEGKSNVKSVQLDGKGAKEKIYYTEKRTLNKKMSTEYTDYYDTETKIYINNKQVFKKKLKGITQYHSTEVIITDVSKKDKVKDILVGSHYRPWCGDYQYLYHFQYSNKKLSKADNVLKTLEKLQNKTPKNIMSDYVYEVSCAESIKTMEETFVTAGDGQIETAVCITPRNGGVNWFEHAHGSTYLKLNKNNKLVPADSMPSGTIEEIGNSVSMKKPTTLLIKTDNGKKISGYKKPGDKKSSMKVASGSTVTLLSYQYSGKKLFIQLRTASGKKCWIDANNKHLLNVCVGTLHA